MQLGLQSVILGLTAVITLSSGASPGVQKTVQTEIRQSIDKHHQASDFHDWADSPNTPERIFDRWQSSPEATAIAAVVCAELAQLKQDEVALFQEAMESHPFAQRLACRDSVLNLVKSFFDFANKAITGKLPPLPLIIGRDGQPAEPGPLGPSLEMDVSTEAGPIYFNADLDAKHVAFTFDDGPHTKNTVDLLEILAKEDIQATFFTVGRNVMANPQIVKDAASAGHSMGNHTWSHQNLKQLSHDQAVEEIMKGFEALWNVLGYSHPFFRFPFGNRTENLQGFVKGQEFGTFFWNVDTLDWKHKDPDFLYDYALEQIEKQGRGIILFHDIQPQTVVVMPHLLHTLKAKGYVPVVFRAPTVSPAAANP